MESLNVDNPSIEWLQGYLRAFAWFNNKTNYGYTFTLDAILKPKSIREAIEGYFREELIEMSLSPVEDWQSTVRGLLNRWLFQFGDHTMDYLEDTRNSFSLFYEPFREMMLDEVMNRFTRMVSPFAVWKVEVATRCFYECHCEDLVFEEPSRIIYMHLGVSD
jgi:hypothetical protein